MPGRIDRELPPELEELAELATDLRWVGSQLAGRIWSRLDPEAWERTRNPYLVLLNAPQERLDAAAGDEPLQAELARWLELREQYVRAPGWFGRVHGAAGLGRIAYFSMEFGLSEGLPIYSGGLGILAGDHLKSASDLGVPIVGIGLLYQEGYFRQVLGPDGAQVEAFPHNDPTMLPIEPVPGADGRWPRVHLPLPGRTVLLRPWRVRVGKVDLLLLDTNDPMNSPSDRAITANLYTGGQERRLLQELVLGVGGWLLLEKLGIDVDVCHLNEGHAAFAVMARAGRFARDHGVSFDEAVLATRAGNVFTTHTPVAAAFDRFAPDRIARVLAPIATELNIPLERVYDMGRRDPTNWDEPLNMAYLALRGCGAVNGVSALHGRVSRRLFAEIFPCWSDWEVPIGSITNGVHVPTWDSPRANELWGGIAEGPRWTEELETLGPIIGDETRVSDIDLWRFRCFGRRDLVHYVRKRFQRQEREGGADEAASERAGTVLDPNVLTFGFARRFAEYKRPLLLLHEMERFVSILSNPFRPAQLVVAGKAHPADDHGRSMVRTMARFAARPDVFGRVVFLQDYDMAVAERLAGGVDVWLNTPRRPAEACGTSGMKMLANGGLNLSTLDGWWDEAYDPQVGWALGGGREHDGSGDAEEARELYDLLEHRVIPEFYDRGADGVPHRWVARVRASMTRLTVPFSSDRMVREYVERLYLPAAVEHGRRAADDGRLARALHEWHQRLDDWWPSVRITSARAQPIDGGWRFVARVMLGGLPAEDVEVQVFAEPQRDETEPIVAPMTAADGTYHADIRTSRPREHFTVRVVPCHPDARVPLEASHVRWAEAVATLQPA